MAFRQGAMVSVDVLYRWSPPRIKRVLDFVVALRRWLLMAVIIWWGWDYANRGKVQTMIGLERVDVLGLPGHAGGRLFCVSGHRRQLLDPQRMELETAQ
jgi:TRAP-type C4-dicarboxylate transport system permease small subunit